MLQAHKFGARRRIDIERIDITIGEEVIGVVFMHSVGVF